MLLYVCVVHCQNSFTYVTPFFPRGLRPMGLSSPSIPLPVVLLYSGGQQY